MWQCIHLDPPRTPRSYRAACRSRGSPTEAVGPNRVLCAQRTSCCPQHRPRFSRNEPELLRDGLLPTSGHQGRKAAVIQLKDRTATAGGPLIGDDLGLGLGTACKAHSGQQPLRPMGSSKPSIRLTVSNRVGHRPPVLAKSSAGIMSLSGVFRHLSLCFAVAKPCNSRQGPGSEEAPSRRHVCTAPQFPIGPTASAGSREVCTSCNEDEKHCVQRNKDNDKETEGDGGERAREERVARKQRCKSMMLPAPAARNKAKLLIEAANTRNRTTQTSCTTVGMEHANYCFLCERVCFERFASMSQTCQNVCGRTCLDSARHSRLGN